MYGVIAIHQSKPRRHHLHDRPLPLAFNTLNYPHKALYPFRYNLPTTALPLYSKCFQTRNIITL